MTDRARRERSAHLATRRRANVTRLGPPARGLPPCRRVGVRCVPSQGRDSLDYVRCTDTLRSLTTAGSIRREASSRLPVQRVIAVGPRRGPAYGGSRGRELLPLSECAVSSACLTDGSSTGCLPDDTNPRLETRPTWTSIQLLVARLRSCISVSACTRQSASRSGWYSTWVCVAV